MTGPSQPTVFAGLTQDELDRAYDQSFWAVDADEIQGRIIARSQDVAREMPPRTLRYGDGERQLIDLFLPTNACCAPVFILIHGGAWRLSMREGFYGSAPSFTRAGCILAVVGFDCLPAVSMVRMAEQIQKAVLRLAAGIGAFGGDAGNLHLVGHSSGAHLAAVALTANLGAATSGLRGGTLISGLYDLAPVMRSSRRNYIELAPEQAEALSPMMRLGNFAGIGSVWWGAHESPEFARQSREFAAALRTRGKLSPSGMLSDRNHFEMLEELHNPDSPLMKAMLAAARG